MIDPRDVWNRPDFLDFLIMCQDKGLQFADLDQAYIAFLQYKSNK